MCMPHRTPWLFDSPAHVTQCTPTTRSTLFQFPSSIYMCILTHTYISNSPTHVSIFLLLLPLRHIVISIWNGVISNNRVHRSIFRRALLQNFWESIIFRSAISILFDELYLVHSFCRCGMFGNSFSLVSAAVSLAISAIGTRQVFLKKRYIRASIA